jgi:hypothetical protein
VGGLAGGGVYWPTDASEAATSQVSKNGHFFIYSSHVSAGSCGLTQQFFIHQTLTFLQLIDLGLWLSNQRSVFVQLEGFSAVRRAPPCLLSIFSSERLSLGEILVRRTSLLDKKNKRPSLE